MARRQVMSRGTPKFTVMIVMSQGKNRIIPPAPYDTSESLAVPLRLFESAVFSVRTSVSNHRITPQDSEVMVQFRSNLLLSFLRQKHHNHLVLSSPMYAQIPELVLRSLLDQRSDMISVPIRHTSHQV